MRRYFGLNLLAATFLAAVFLPVAFLQAEEPAAPAEPTEKIALELYQLPNQSRTQMMSYILKADDGSLIVIDGGTSKDADYLAEKIKELRPDGQVAAWLLTHLHSDHVNALCTLIDAQRTDINIDAVWYHFPPLEWFEQHTSQGEVKEAKRYYKSIAAFDSERLKTPQPGQTLTFGSVTIETLNDFDPAITVNPVNNTSIVYRVTTPKTAILFLGDLGVEGGERLLKNLPPEKIKADIVQMAHHGQVGVAKEFYDAVRPTVCLWCAPDWLWNNNKGGEGDGSGPWKTVQNRAWMDDLGVKRHYVIKDGLAVLKLE